MKLFLAGLATGALVMFGAIHLADKWELQEQREICGILSREQSQNREVTYGLPSRYRLLSVVDFGTRMLNK